MSGESAIYAVSMTEQATQGAVVQSAGVELRTRELIYMPASEFNGYNETLPGAADRLLTLFEEQARHRMEVEKTQIQAELSRIQNDHEHSKMAIEADQSSRSQAAGVGLLALMFFVVLSVFFAFMGMQGAAIAAIIIPGVQCIGDWIGKLTRDRNTRETDNTP